MTVNDFKMPTKEFANLFDHTLLRPHAQEHEFEKLCAEAAKYGFKMVAINAAAVPLCKKLLSGTPVHVGAAVSFPLGQCLLKTKLFETADSIDLGADEIDYVINIGKLKAKDYGYIEREMSGVVNLCRSAGVISKVIFENCYLEDSEKEILCKIAVDTGIDFVKTSTGFGAGGATVEDVALMKRCVGDKVKVKAAGGIRTLESAIAMVEAGAERIGASAGVTIVDELMKIRGESF